MRKQRLALLVLLLLATPAAVQAQFDYTATEFSVSITGYWGNGGALTIPGSIAGLPVTDIAPYAFSDQTNLTSVAIPGTVSQIDESAFADCTSLTSVTMASGVVNIGELAFYNCTSLTSVAIACSVTNITDEAFQGCTSLTSITIPASVTTIGDNAFTDCIKLTTMNFEGNAPWLGNTPFMYDTNLSANFLPGNSGFDDGPPAPGLGELWSLPYPIILNDSVGFTRNSHLLAFTISWATNATVVVEACTNLASGVWTPLATNSQAVNYNSGGEPEGGGTSTFVDDQWTNYPARFYRIRSP